jgi:ribosomal protein S18 acetylase RimI-like enzyme
VSDVTLRTATADDAQGLVALMKGVAIEGRWIRTQWPFDEAERVERFSGTIGGGLVLCIVAERYGRIVGQISLFPSDDVAEFGMFVEPSERARGLGRRLMDAGEALARERGFVGMELEVYAHNEAAIALYRSAGFEEFGDRFPELRTSGELYDVVRMRKAIAKSPKS